MALGAGRFRRVFLLMFAGCAVVLGGTAKVLDDAAKDIQAKENKIATGVVGKPVTNAGMTYTVTKVSKTPTLSDGTTAETGAAFVVANVTLKNEKNETKTFTNANAHVASGPLKFETSDKTAIVWGDKSLALQDLQPDLPVSGILAFEVPTTKLPGAALVIEDLWGNGKVSIQLGL